MKNTVYFFFPMAGRHNMPLNRTLKAEFSDWDTYIGFLESDFMEKAGAEILACHGNDGLLPTPPEMLLKMRKAVPDIDNALLVAVKWLPDGMYLEIPKH